MRIQSIFFAVAILSAFTGCAVHLPNGANVQYQGRNGAVGVQLGGQAQQAQKAQQALQVSCPAGSRWDGRGCLVTGDHLVPVPILIPPFGGRNCPSNSWDDGRGCRRYQPFQNSQSCFSGGRMINGAWYCMDQMSFSFKTFSEEEGFDYIEPLEESFQES